MGFMKQKFFTRAIYFLVLTAVLSLPSCELANDEIPPEDITNLVVTAKGEAVEFQWTNPSDSDFSYVEIRTTAKGENYYHTSIVPGKATSYTVEELTNNVEYQFCIISYDTSKNHSAGINTYSVPSGLGDVRKVKSTYSEDEIFVSWENPKDKKFAGVEITIVNEDVPEDYDETENNSEDSLFIPVVQEASVQNASEQNDEVQSEELPLIEELPMLEETEAELPAEQEELPEEIFVPEEPFIPFTEVTETLPPDEEAPVQQYLPAEENSSAEETAEVISEEESQSEQIDSEETPQSEQADSEQTDSSEEAPAQEEEQEEEVPEISEEEITEQLLQNKKAVEEKKKFHKLTVRTDDTVVNSYKFTGLTSGALYTVSLTAYDIDGNSSATVSFVTQLPEETDGLEYSLNSDGTAYVVTSFKGDGSSDHVITPEEENGYIENPISVVVPKMHNGKPVVEIGQAAFKDCRSITEITLPSSITVIGKNAFENCAGLEGVIIPENTVVIADGTFWNCLNLKWLVIPKSVKKIGLGAILNDTRFATVFYTGTEEEWKVLEKNIESGNAMLKNFSRRILSKPAEIRFEYDGTTPVELLPPEQVDSVVAEGGNCYALLSWSNPSDTDFAGVKIEVLEPAEKVLNTYFVSPSLNSFIVTGLENDHTYFFNIYSFDKLKNYSEPVKTQKVKTELITQIDEDGFYYFINEDGISCSVCGIEQSRKTITIPDVISNYPVTQISEQAFAEDNVLEILVLPETVSIIADTAFENCSMLSNIYYCGSYSQWEDIEGIEELDAVLRTDFVFVEDDQEPPAEAVLDFIRRGDSKIGFDLTLPSDCDFYKALFEVDGVSTEAAKVGESSYAILNLENEIKYSVRIKTQDIYGNVSEGIEFSAEAGEIIPEGVTKDGFHFIRCDNDSELSGTSYMIIAYEKSSSFDQNSNIHVEFPSVIDDVVVTEIASEVFAEVKNIESVTIPATVEAIGNGALCLDSIKQIYVNPANKVYSLNADGTILYSRKGNSKRLEQVLPCVSGTVDFTGIQLTEISPKAFAECRKITKIVLPLRLKKIGDGAFCNCRMLGSIYLPSTVISAGKNVFEGCDKLTACYYQGTEKQFNRIEFTGGDKKLLSVIKYYGSGK